MPLVVPGLQSKGGDDKTSKWMNSLMGKKIGESSDQTVCSSPLPFSPLLQISFGLISISDVCKDGIASEAPYRQGRRDDDHGS